MYGSGAISALQKYDVPLGAIWFGLSRICVEQHCADNTNEIADETSRGRAVEDASPYNNVVRILKIVQKRDDPRSPLIFIQRCKFVSYHNVWRKMPVTASDYLTVFSV